LPFFIEGGKKILQKKVSPEIPKKIPGTIKITIYSEKIAIYAQWAGTWGRRVRPLVFILRLRGAASTVLLVFRPSMVDKSTGRGIMPW
jgi:hypothetical protein